MKVIKKCFPYFAVVICAFITSYSVRAFINKSGLLTSGVTGICLIISRYIGMFYYNTSLTDLLHNPEQMNLVNTLTSSLYFAINIPLIFLSFKKLGKRFATLSTLYIIANTVFIKFLPNNIMNIFNIEEGGLANALFAGVCSGIAISLALNVGGSTGGLEIIATYFSRKKQISIGKILMVVNAFIIILGGFILREWTPILYTLVLVFVSGRVVDTLHRFTNKIVIIVITDFDKEISKEISCQTHYSCTAWKSYGGYSGNEKITLMTVVPESKSNLIIQIIKNIDPNSFITTLDSNSVHGNFYIEPLK